MTGLVMEYRLFCAGWPQVLMFGVFFEKPRSTSNIKCIVKQLKKAVFLSVTAWRKKSHATLACWMTSKNIFIVSHTDACF